MEDSWEVLKDSTGSSIPETSNGERIPAGFTVSISKLEHSGGRGTLILNAEFIMDLRQESGVLLKDDEGIRILLRI